MMLATGIIVLIGSFCTFADAAPKEIFKPVWLTDCSVSLKESYDDNVFLSGVNPKFFPAKYAAPAGGVVALPDAWSWLTTVSPKLGFNFSPLLGDGQVLKNLSLVYAPDFAVYHDQTSESCNTHRWLTSLKAATGKFSASVDNTLTYVDGSNVSPLYPGGLYSAFTTAAVRERREQLQDKSGMTLQYDEEKWFVRATAALAYYDLMTEQINLTGYQNYCDRADVNGGGDFGWKISPAFALTLGWRYGHQYQEQYAFSPDSSSSDYQRILAGFEGRPWKWLEVKVQAGPDLRSYPGDTATHVTPVNDKSPAKFFGEESFTATLSSANTLTLKGRQWQWVSSTGKVPCYDASGELGFHHQFTRQFGLDLGGRIWTWDYNSGNLTTCHRHDWQYTFNTGATYAINAHFSLNAGWSLDLGRNSEENIANPETREFDRQIVSVGAQLKF